MNLIKEYAKAIAAFVLGVVVNLVVNLVNGTTPWPQTGGQWGQLLVTSFGPAIAAALFPNKISDKQIAKDPTVVRVTPQAPSLPPNADGTYRNPWS